MNVNECEGVPMRLHDCLVRVLPAEFARQDPASVPAVIAAWVKALQGLEQAQHTQQALLDLLNTRPGHTQPKSAQVPALVF